MALPLGTGVNCEVDRSTSSYSYSDDLSCGFDGIGDDQAAGNDPLLLALGGGTGDDALRGRAGSDTLFGRAGNDALHGGNDTDTCHPGTGTNAAFSCETTPAP